MMMNKRPLARLLLPLLLATAAPAARAQAVDITPPSPAHALQCLERRPKPPAFPERHDLDRGYGFMRVLLRFDKPDAKPTVEVLANTAREDMQDEVYRYLASYRLPCLTPQDGVVNAVQEFSFSNTDREVLPYDDGQSKRRPLCVVMPRQKMEGWNSIGRQLEHVAVTLVFDGDGQQPPLVKVIYSTGDTQLEKEVTRYASQYRMPCRNAGDPPSAMRQNFTFRPAGVGMETFRRERFGLIEFLRMTKGIRELSADFDFNTMGCPFAVTYEVLGPALPNEVQVAGKRDPNRTAFLKWLSERDLGFKDARQASSLFGTRLQIDVPCSRLALKAPADSGGG